MIYSIAFVFQIVSNVMVSTVTSRAHPVLSVPSCEKDLSKDFTSFGGIFGDSKIITKPIEKIETFNFSNDTEDMDNKLSDTGNLPLKSELLKARGCDINLTKYLLPSAMKSSRLGQNGLDPHTDSDSTDNESESNELTKTEVMLYMENLLKHFWDKHDQKWIHPRTGKKMHMQEGIDCGVICPEIVKVVTSDFKTVTLQKAINSGQINIHTGATIDMKTGKPKAFHVAKRKGLIVIQDDEPIEKCDMYTELGPGLVSLIARREVMQGTKILDRRLDQLLDIPKCIDAFIFDTEWGKVKDSRSGQWMTWLEAKENGLVYDPKEGKLTGEENDDETILLEESDKHIVNLNEFVDDSGKREYGGHILFNQVQKKSVTWKKDVTDCLQNPVVTPTGRRSSLAQIKLQSATFPIALDEAIQLNIYDPVCNSILVPSSGKKLPLEMAIKDNFISNESLIRDPVSKDILSLQEAIEKRIIDPESGKMIDANEQTIALNFAFKMGLIMRSKSPLKLSLTEILDEGLYDEELNTFLNPDSNLEITFSEAVTCGLLDSDSISILDTSCHKVLKLEEALESNCISLDTGICVDTANQERMHIPDALEKGILIDLSSQPKLSLQSAIEEGIFDFCSAQLLDATLGLTYSLGDAIKSNFLDADSVLVRDPSSLTILTLDAAIAEKIIDPQDGRYSSGATELSFEDAFENGLIFYNSCHGMLPCNLLEAIRFNIYDQTTGKYMDPKSGNVLTLERALEDKLVHTRKTMIKDTQTGRFLSVLNSAYLGILNTQTSNIKLLRENSTCEIKVAKEMGVLRRSASDECITLHKAIGKGYINTHGKILDPLSRKSFNLADAISIKIIDDAPTLVKDSKRNKYVPLSDAIDSGLINVQAGVVNDTESLRKLNYSNAVDEGFLIEIPPSGLSLAEAVEHGLFVEEKCKVRDIRTGKYLSLQESIDQRFVDATSPQVVIPCIGIFSLKDSIQLQYLDPETGRYLHGDQPISLPEAVEKCLVVTLGGKRCKRRTPDLCVDEIAGTNRWSDLLVKDHFKRKYISMEEATKEGIIDIQTEIFCDFKNDNVMTVSEALLESLIVDKKAPKIGLANAILLGLIDTVNNSVLDPRTNQDIPLRDGIRSGIIDLHCTRIKDLATGKFLPMKEALKKGIISDRTGTVFEKEKKISVPLEVSVREGLVVDFTRTSFTVPEGLMYGMITHDGLMVEDLQTGTFMAFNDAVEKGVIDTRNTQVKQSDDEISLSLEDAIEHNILDGFSGVLKLKSGRRMSVAEAVSQSYIVVKEDTNALSDPDGILLSKDFERMIEACDFDEVPKQLKTMNSNLYNSDGNMYAYNVGKCFAKTVEQHEIESLRDSVDYMNMGGNYVERRDSHSSPVRFDEALKFGLLDLEKGDFIDNFTHERSSIEIAANEGRLGIMRVMFYDESENRNIPLNEALKHGMLFQNSSVNEKTERLGCKVLTFQEAIDKGYLTVTTKIPAPPSHDDDQISIKSDTFSQSTDTGKQLDWITSSKTMSSSLDSLIQNVRQEQSGFRIGTLFDAVEKGLFLEEGGLLLDTFMQKQMKIDEAIKCGLINSKAKEIKDPLTGELLSLDEALSSCIIDCEKGCYIDQQSGSVMSLESARNAGFIVKCEDQHESKSSVEIYVEEILTNEQKKGKNRFRDAFSTGILHRANSQVIDPDSIQPITLRRAGSLGMIDTKTGEFKNPQTGESLSLAEAVQKGYILSPKGLSLYSAVNQGLYCEITGQFRDPETSCYLSLAEMIVKDIITSNCAEVRDVTKDNTIVRLKDAIKKGIIDADKGVYVSPDLRKLNFKDAITEGLIKLNFKEAISAGLIISNIPREGLRESSNGVSNIMKRQHWEDKGVRKDTTMGEQLMKYPTMQRKTLEQKVSNSMSSVETGSSGYETNVSVNMNTVEDPSKIATSDVKHTNSIPSEESGIVDQDEQSLMTSSQLSERDITIVDAQVEKSEFDMTDEHIKLQATQEERKCRNDNSSEKNKVQGQVEKILSTDSLHKVTGKVLLSKGTEKILSADSLHKVNGKVSLSEGTEKKETMLGKLTVNIDKTFFDRVLKSPNSPHSSEVAMVSPSLNPLSTPHGQRLLFSPQKNTEFTFHASTHQSQSEDRKVSLGMEFFD